MYEILVAGRYSTFEAGGRRGAQRLEVGEVVEFPTDYGRGLVEAGLVWEMRGDQMGMMGISAARVRARIEEVEGMEGDGSVGEGEVAQEVAEAEGVRLEEVEGMEGDGSVGEVEATEAARELAEAEGVQLEEVEGTGKDGRVTVGDVRRVLRIENGELRKENGDEEGNGSLVG